MPTFADVNVFYLVGFHLIFARFNTINYEMSLLSITFKKVSPIYIIKDHKRRPSGRLPFPNQLFRHILLIFLTLKFRSIFMHFGLGLEIYFVGNFRK